MNNNGIISFGSSFTRLTNVQNPFPFAGGTELIAPFWADVDTTPDDGGFVWYRQTMDSTLLNRGMDEILAAFTAVDSFTPTFMFIATWDHVGYFFRNTDRVCTMSKCCVGMHSVSYAGRLNAQ